jgi:mannose-6-phosphate isomerase-like protein (cupin superfamily)
MHRRQTLLLIALLPLLTQVQGEPQELALAKAANDPRVQWGPCPAFMPKGCGLAVLHGDPARPNADVFLKIPAKVDLAHHSHSSAERMILVAGELTVKYDGQPAAKLRPGMYAYGPAKLGHSATCTSKDECVLFIAFEGPIDAIATPLQKK